jgi:hypothetical protein
MSDTITPDMFAAALKNVATQNRPSEYIKLATDRVAVERNQHLIDSFIEKRWRETTLSN